MAMEAKEMTFLNYVFAMFVKTLTLAFAAFAGVLTGRRIRDKKDAVKEDTKK